MFLSEANQTFVLWWEVSGLGKSRHFGTPKSSKFLLPTLTNFLDSQGDLSFLVLIFAFTQNISIYHEKLKFFKNLEKLEIYRNASLSISRTLERQKYANEQNNNETQNSSGHPSNQMGILLKQII